MRQDFNEFKKFIKGKKVAVVGVGVSNTPLINMLLSMGADITACDKKASLGEIEEDLKCKGVKLFLGENYLEGTLDCDVIFRTPSMRPDNPYLLRAKERGAYITSEIGEFMKYCPAKIFGITGSDGKTTTTSLTYEILRTEGHNAFLGGNIGEPLFNRIENIKSSDYVVVELSSFQLMDCLYSPEVAAITNLSPNHLDIHKDMVEYVNSKKNIFLHQSNDSITVLNMDNEITYSMINEVKGELRTFSIKDQSAYSHLEGEVLVVNGKKICSRDEVVIPGMHNIENLLTAFALTDGYVSAEAMRKVALTFPGVEHRIEFVREINSIRFYNDSMASSPTRTIANLKAFSKNIILIAGGYDKKIPFDELAREGIDRIKTLVLIGKTSDKIEEAFEREMKLRGRRINIIKADSLEDAVYKCYDSARPGDIITLSPACASFDMFKDFADRGNRFKKIVMEING